MYSDAKSEFAVGLYKLIEPHGTDGMNAVPSSGMINWLQSAEALKSVTAGATNWALASGGYATFRKAPRQCAGFVRDGRGVGGQIMWLLGAAFCRESDSPITTSEAQFVADSLKVKD